MILRIIIGLVLGYLIGSLLESLIHKYVLHASDSVVRYWKKYPKIFRPFLQERYIHEIHHRHTFKRDFVTQFESVDEINQLHAMISPLKAELVSHIKKTEYGLFAQPKGLLYIGIITSVLFAIPMYYLLGFWVLVGAAIPMYFLAYIMSRYIHPYSHMKYEDVFRKSSGFLGILIKTRYAQKVIRYHFLHHENNRCNYNLILGFDFLVGWAKNENNLEKEKMKSIGVKTNDVA
jgi:hypothetical protein